MSFAKPGLADLGFWPDGCPTFWALLALAVCLCGCRGPDVRPGARPDGKPAASRFALALAPPLQGADGLARLVAESEALLPAKVRERIGRLVVVELDPTRGAEPIRPPVCDPAADAVARPIQTLGVAQLGARGSPEAPHRIYLHPAIVEIARQGPAAAAQFPCGHGSLYRLAQATILHEVLHLYDQLAGLSDRPDYQHMQQFARQGALRRLQARNRLQLRSPDPYELHDIRENLAVNFEYFLLDPDFQCRRPSVYELLATALQHRPFPAHGCRVNTLIYAGNQPTYLDPERVYQIHYLFAARGKGIASRFGHSMFRVVSCAPTRPSVDARCLEDLHDQVVLSFVANLREDLTISAWKGLTGGYMSLLTIQPLTEILNDYTEIDHRDLQSIPLDLTRDEIRRFIHHTLELYWGYSGRYYFLTNNCADESLRLVQSVVAGDDVQGLEVLTPLGLRDVLIERKLADAAMLADRQAALRAGFLFESAIERYEAVYQKFRSTLPAAAPRKLDRYLRNTRAATRRTWAMGLLSRPASLAGLFTIEGLILQRLMKEIEKLVLLRVLYTRDSRYDVLGQKLKDHLASLRLPWELVKGGYGIPLPHEFAPAQRQVHPQFPKEILELALSLVKTDDAKLYQEYAQTEQNRKFILAEILKTAGASPSASLDQAKLGRDQP